VIRPVQSLTGHGLVALDLPIRQDGADNSGCSISPQVTPTSPVCADFFFGKPHPGAETRRGNATDSIRRPCWPKSMFRRRPRARALRFVTAMAPDTSRARHQSCPGALAECCGQDADSSRFTCPRSGKAEDGDTAARSSLSAMLLRAMQKTT
jgi:hypothetical protein